MAAMTPVPIIKGSKVGKTVTDHDRGEAMGSLYHAAGLHLILSMPARGTATSEHLAIYALRFLFRQPQLPVLAYWANKE